MRTITSSDGLQIKIGENAVENQALCKEARQNDLWFHLENMSSPHAILSLTASKKKISDVRESIHECAQLIKHFSKGKKMREVTVIFVEAKFVSKNGVENKLGAVSLKKTPTSRSVVFDEACVTALLSRVKKS